MFGKIGKFLEKNVIQPIDRAIIRPIDKAVIQPIDKAIVEPLKVATDKDYALRHETARLDAAKIRYANSRPPFFRARQKLEVTRAEYERVVEDFRSVHGAEAAKVVVRQVTDPGVKTDPGTGAMKVVKDIENGARTVLKTVTLGLTEAIWNADEIPKARKYLEAKSKEFSQAAQQLEEATWSMTQACDHLRDATEQVRARHAELGADATASDVHVEQAQHSAQLQIASQLLEDGHSADDIADMTGIAPDIIRQAELAPAS